MRFVTKTAAGSVLILLSVTAVAEEPASPHEWSANVAVMTEYLYRGITQTNEGPTVQGGFDYSYTPLGFYVGVWASNIEFNTPGNGNDASFEIDYYGGFAGEWSNGIGWDVGVLYYYYPDHDEDAAAGDYDMFEVNGALSYTFSLPFEPTVETGFAYSPDFFGEDGDGIYVHGNISFVLPHDFGFHAMVG